jgi:hypothetical protein
MLSNTQIAKHAVKNPHTGKIVFLTDKEKATCDKYGEQLYFR